MKKITIFVVVILLLISSVACNQTSQTNPTPADETPLPTTADLPYEVVYDELFDVFNPYTEILDQDLLVAIGADGFSGSDEEIANQILQWQADNMQYIGNPMEQEDISYPMRWNYFLPGIFPVSDMVTERVLSNGKIYGLCWDYAAIYCSLASTYGLETRVTAVKVLLSDINPSIDKSTSHGMAYDEYEALNNRFTKLGLNFTYDQVSRVANETWAHYRAEVFLNGEWVGMDGSGPVGEGYDEFEEAPWYEGYNNKTLYEPNAALADLDAICELLEDAPVDGYAGITDDAGNPNRAADKYDLHAGKGLVPYFADVDDAIDFLELSAGVARELAIEEGEIQEEFESMTGELFYVVADALIFNAVEEIDAESYAMYYEALTGVAMPLAYAQALTE